jgi:NAD(P)-dependent dehydrogenase (short-subunit alcohol dehydrogenase family)
MLTHATDQYGLRERNGMSGKMLDGKVAVVTGAGRGIGRATAVCLAANGAQVVVNDVGAAVTGEGLDAGPAQQVVAEIAQANGQGRAVANTDSVADWESAQRIVQTAIDTFGRIDIVVNNAGILRDRMFHYMSPEEWDAVIKVHLYGAFYVSRAAVTHFRKRESGCFVHITSTSGLIGSVGQVNYGAAKLGIAGLSRNIAMDMRRYNIRSNCIGPHAFSRMIETVPGQSEEQLKARAEKTKPDHIAQLIAFLGTDAAKEVSGQIFGVRGNEVYLYNQPRPVRIMARSDGWTPEKLAEHWLPAVKSSFTPLERTRDVYNWDPL